jgi:hypothetical protein
LRPWFQPHNSDVPAVGAAQQIRGDYSKAVSG